MDYSKLSDAGIASKVLIAQGYKLIDDGYGYSIYISDSGRKDIGPKASKKFVFDPCNNPADAWQIIVGSRISLSPFDDFKEGGDYIAAKYKPTRDNSKPAEVEFFCCDKPLRAAMIVYLMMREGE